MNDEVIKFENFGFQYTAQSKPTLYDINLSIHKGEKILIVGPSGCGKSTLIHCLNGLIPFSYEGEITGSLKINGTETAAQSIFDISKQVGTVLQDSDGQFIGLTVAEDIAFSLENDMVSTDLMKKYVAEVAREVEAENFLDHAPHEISGGQKQRVSLAGVMVNKVDILLFDEPLANLDPATGKQAMVLIDEVAKRNNQTVIIIEHRVEDALYKDIDRIILMNNGRIVADASPDELLSSNALIENGIREPLYLTCLKYAGVKINKDMHPSNINTLTLSADDKNKVAEWVKNVQSAPSDEKRPLQFSAENINFSYENGRKALHDISLQFNKGELLSIVGKNGAGKSTFSKLICGFETPQTGTLTLDGINLSTLSIKERADHIGYVMQNPNQMISKTLIFDEVAIGLVMRKVSPADIEKRVTDTLAICGLLPFRSWPISALSYGQKKRVTIASILVLSPEIIILDEPTAGQDFKHYTEIMEFLLQLNKKGVTVVMITHDMHLMLEYSHRALVFSDGHLIANDTCANILTSDEITTQANLKKTSLYDLAVLCNVQDPHTFVQSFIDFDRKVRAK
ncbi:MAG: ABC transporter ATP-binding protein [Oscillospiraceae bacterium]